MKKCRLFNLHVLLFVCSLLFIATGCAQNPKPYDIPRLPKKIKNKEYCREGYTVGYNKNRRVANFVAWHLTRERINGPASRKCSRFKEDEELPIPRATLEDYKGSGWSRGHLCPAGDNKWCQEAMDDSFFLTNICPQDESLNSGIWNQIEMKCREWADYYGDILIVTGPIFNKKIKTIGPNKVAVPDYFFKVVMSLDAHTKAIGFICPNKKIPGKMYDYVVSVDEVEKITGFDFFPSIPKETQNRAEKMKDISIWDPKL